MGLGTCILTSPLVTAAQWGLRIPDTGLLLISFLLGHALQTTALLQLYGKMGCQGPPHTMLQLPALPWRLPHQLLAVRLSRLFKKGILEFPLWLSGKEPD